MFGGLDLTQITSTEGPRGEGEDVPAMFYDPSKEMSEEEMKEADPDGQLSIPEQVVKEVSMSEWPTAFGALKEGILVVLLIVGTAALIVNWDAFLREAVMNIGIVPRPEDVMQGSENIALPDGWTNGMSEDDFMNFQDEVGTFSSSPAPELPDIKLPGLN